MKPGVLQHYARDASGGFAVWTLTCRQRPPKFLTDDTVLAQAARFEDKPEREQERDIRRRQKRGGRFKIVQHDQQKANQNGEERVPDAQAEGSISNVVHG